LEGRINFPNSAPNILDEAGNPIVTIFLSLTFASQNFFTRFFAHCEGKCYGDPFWMFSPNNGRATLKSVRTKTNGFIQDAFVIKSTSGFY